MLLREFDVRLYDCLSTVPLMTPVFSGTADVSCFMSKTRISCWNGTLYTNEHFRGVRTDLDSLE